MKGIAHFVTGVAVASCLPAVVAAGATHNPLYFVLGGVFGLLPDTLDFKFYRFFYRHDMDIVPDPNAPDPQMIADGLALAVNEAHRRKRPVRAKLHTVRLGADLWQQYVVRFDVANRRVCVRLGPAVSTSRTPIGTAPAKATVTIDILDGPTFTMQPQTDGRVLASFIPWHRAWSHSLVLAAAFAAAGWLLIDAVAATVIFASFAAHALLDQAGYLGSALWFPISRRRVPGLQRLHSADALPNFAVVWTCCLLVFWNLHRGLAHAPFRLPLLGLLFFGALLPLSGLALLRRALRE